MTVFMQIFTLAFFIGYCWMMKEMIRETREIRRNLDAIRRLTLDSRSHQGSIRTRQSITGSPAIDRAKQQGPRHPDLPHTGRQVSALKFKRVGGEYDDEGYTDGDRLQQDRRSPDEAERKARRSGRQADSSS